MTNGIANTIRKVFMVITEKTKKLALITFILYMLVLFWIIILKCNMKAPISDTRALNEGKDLWQRLSEYLVNKTIKTDTKDSIVNVILFLPVGMLLPFFFKKGKYLKTCALGLLLTVFFELFQIISCYGWFTYADIIHNAAGAFIGAFIHFLLLKIAKEKPLSITFYILFAVLGVTAIIGYINTIINIGIYI
jgi:glycopeptide antibiotics resistance protein